MNSTAVHKPTSTSSRMRTRMFTQARPARVHVRAVCNAHSCSRQAKAPQKHEQVLRVAAAVALSAAVMVLTPEQSLAKMAPTNQEVDNASSPMIQAMLKRTEEMREQRYKERLDDYYRRNFKEYFDFEGGNAGAAKARGLSSQTQQEIAKWLAENK